MAFSYSLIHAGDLAYNLDTDEGRVGDRFMEQIEPISSRLPYLLREIDIMSSSESSFNLPPYEMDLFMTSLNANM